MDIHPWFDFLPLERGDALFEQLAVEFETNRGDVAALLRPQHVTGPSNLQVAHRDLKSAAQRRVLFYGADALARLGQHSGMARNQKIGIRLMFVAPDPSAKLIEIAQPEPIRPIDDDRVGVRNVDAAFDDRR